MKKFNLHLYLVTDEASKCRLSLLETVRKAADGGVTIVQYRSTNPDAGTCYREALPIRDFLASRGIPFIVNNRIDLALALEADGVHIGQRDLPVPSVRAMIGPDKILGLSVSNKEQLRAVDASLVDYLGMGPVFPTISKLNAPPVLGVEGFAALASQSPLPVVAIGGITQESVQQAAELAIAMQAAGEPRAMPLDYEDVNVGAKVVKLIQSYTPIVNETVWLKR